MRGVALALAIVFAASLHAQPADVVRAIKALEQVQRIAHIIELQRAGGGRPNAAAPDLMDPYGTLLRISIEADTYRIVSAGSDRKFDEASWSVEKQFSGTEGDLVLANGRMLRSNRNWLSERELTKEETDALQALRRAELALIIARNPVGATVTAAGLTMNSMMQIGSNIRTYRERSLAPGLDAWGTPLRVVYEGETYRIVSAGQDREFDLASWKTPAQLTDPKGDLVFEDGRFTRIFDARAFLAAAGEVVVSPIPQPAEDPLPGTEKWERAGAGIAAPVVTNRVEPAYPADYRTARLSGVVILEIAVDATGAVQGVRVLKSLAPEFDLAARRAARQWKFQPAMKNGAAVPVLFNLSINFKLK
jgi:protein TonB